jgi:hypothetical protein
MSEFTVGSWFLYWKLALSSTNNSYHVTTHSQGYQAGIIAQLEDDYSGWQSDQAAANGGGSKGNYWAGQAKDIQRDFCQNYANLTQIPKNLEEDAKQLKCS